MSVFDLSKLTWTLSGWRPHSWRLGGGAGPITPLVPDIGPIPARVPGSVQQALLEAGIIRDWNVGVNSRDCEWVEHRHWVFEATIPAGTITAGERARLDADGLDYSGWILVDWREVARFEGMLVLHRIELPETISDGQAHRLQIVFEEPPREQGQFGYTSLSRFFKSRFNYSWDWCPRIVPIGVWDRLSIVGEPERSFELLSLRTALDADLHTGSVEVIVQAGAACSLTVRVVCEGKELARSQTKGQVGRNEIAMADFCVEPWWPNGHGQQPLYDVAIVAEEGGTPIWSCARRVGFRRIEWAPCEGAPADAEPWICVVNRRPVFLQGTNWVPTRAVYHDVTEAEYRELIDLYREMGCTCLRVWGGAILEKQIFYDLCDEAGILVWQEFPLSSSGVENRPAEDPASISTLCEIASSYIRRRSHHASLLLWCGGNELQWKREGEECPVDYSHPCIAALREVVMREDPDRRFVATSASGPKFFAKASNFGKGVHHDVHGPWGMSLFEDMAAWRRYWERDDALFRSEVGMPGAASRGLIERYCDGMQVIPAEGEYWAHTASWWTQWDLFKNQLPTANIDDYVHMTQQHQAEAYSIAAACSKRRFPKCGGFIIWMGHDCFPCPANNSVIDFDRQPKPAYHALKRVFRGED